MVVDRREVRAVPLLDGYIDGKITRSAILSRHVTGTRAHEIDLDNGITVAIYPASFRAIRGLSVVSCICDEIAFWWTEDGYANPDVEVLRAVRPSMATFPNAKLVLASSPYAMSGVLWDMWRARKKDRDVLVWHAPTALMNPFVPERFLKAEKKRDPENYRREYEAEFTEAVSAFIPAQAIDACVADGRTEMPYEEGSYGYRAAIDAAFKGDRFVLAIAHKTGDNGTIILDHLSGWKGSPGNPIRLKHVIPEIKTQLERYHTSRVFGDQYAAEPLRHAFGEVGIIFKEQPFTSPSKADLYSTLRAYILDGRIELLDHRESPRELRALEVELLPGGGARVGHPKRGGAHDDYADAIALAVSQARRYSGSAGIYVAPPSRWLTEWDSF